MKKAPSGPRRVSVWVSAGGAALAVSLDEIRTAVGLHRRLVEDHRMPLSALLDLAVQLPPLLLGPAELLHRGGEVQEVDRDDGGAGPQVGVAYEGVELAPSLDHAFVDAAEAFGLLGFVRVLAQSDSSGLDRLYLRGKWIEVTAGPAGCTRARAVGVR